jgi:hypothetical protein
VLGKLLAAVSPHQIGEPIHAFDDQRDVVVVHRNQHLVVCVRLDAHGLVGLHSIIPAAFIDEAHLNLVGGYIDACELGVLIAAVIKDDISVGFPTTGWFVQIEGCLHLVIAGQELIDDHDGGRRGVAGIRADCHTAARCGERSFVGVVKRYEDINFLIVPP